MPFKEAVIPLLDELDPSAAGIESVNTIVNTDGFLRGFNTDYTAVLSRLRASGVSGSAEFALRGSGGMAKAVACALRDAGFRSGRIVARNEPAGAALAARYGFRWRPDFPPGAAATVLINATPVGMAGGPEAGELAFPREAVEAAELVFDVVASPPDTPLIRLARAVGRKTIAGPEISVLQAVEQFALYTGQRPEPELVERAAAFAASAAA